MRVVYFGASTRKPLVHATDQLAPLERYLLAMKAKRRTKAQIAELLGVTEQSVEFHLAEAYRKFDVSDRRKAVETTKPAPLVPADLAYAFRQLELLIQYAPLVTSPTTADLSQADLSEADLSKAHLSYLWSSMRDKHGEPVRGTLVGLGDEETWVVSVRMGSPLEVVLQIPAVLWSGIAIGLLALTERITTTPVRIARKRKEELLRSAILDQQIELVRAGSADVLAQLLLEEGPCRATRGPDNIAFLDPDDPDDQLEVA